MENKNHTVYIDYLNVAACIAVIALHCNGCFWVFSDTARYWKTSVIIEHVFYWAVPIFFMIMGCTLLDFDKKYDVKTFFKKRFNRTVIPFLIWSVIAIIFYNKATLLHNISLSWIIDQIINTKTMGVYWFFIPCFAVYLSLPVINAIDEHRRTKIYTYSVIFAFVTISILPCIFNLLKWQYNYGFTTLISGGYLIYVLLGYLLENSYKLNKKQRLFIYGLGIAGLLLRMIPTYYWSLEDGKINSVMGGYTNFPTVLYSVAIFTFFKYEISNWQLLKQIYPLIKKLSAYSLGVYLVHMHFVINLPHILKIADTSIYWRTLGVIVVYVCCLAVVYVLKNIPIVRKIVP